MLSNWLKRGALTPSAAITAISIALATAGAPAALASDMSGPVWQPQQTGIGGLGNGPALVYSAACTGPGSCLAVGGVVTAIPGLPLVLASSNGRWGAPATATVPGGGQGSVYASVACKSAGSCVGVGYTTIINPTTFAPVAGSIAVSGSTVTPAPASVLRVPDADNTDPELAALTSVSCTATSCTAVGFSQNTDGLEVPLVYTDAGSGWVFRPPTLPSAAVEGANLTAVSCPSDGPCEAVGYYLDAGGAGHSWAVQLSGSEQGVTITPPGDAVNVNGSGMLETQPHETPVNLFFESMNGISCPSVGACTAVGNYPRAGELAPMAVKIANGAPGTATALPHPEGVTAATLSGVWCADADDCTVTGETVTVTWVGDGDQVHNYTPVTGYEKTGTWSGLTPPPGAVTGTEKTGASYLNGLGCSALDDCLSVGYFQNDDANVAVPIFSFSAAPLSVTGATLAAATVGSPYSATLPSSGGANAQQWTITAGALPAGLTLNAATGLISGIPTAAGTASFTARLADGPPDQSASAGFSIPVLAAQTAAPPPSPAAAAPRATIGGDRVTPNRVTLTVRCAGAGSCRGRATVTAVEHFRGRKLMGITARATKKRMTAHAKTRLVKITLAHGNYSVSGGRSGKVTLKLTAKAKALLRRLHRFNGTLTLTPAGAGKPIASRTVEFKSATKKKHGVHQPAVGPQRSRARTLLGWRRSVL